MTILSGLLLIGAGLVALTLIPVAIYDLFTKEDKLLNALFSFAFIFAAVFCLWMGWYLLAVA